MPFTFICKECKTRKFFSTQEQGMCSACFANYLKQEEKKRKLQERALKKEQRRVKREQDLNQKLKEDLAKEKIVRKSKAKRREQEEQANLPISKPVYSSLPKTVTLEQQAQNLAGEFDPLLYIYADVKRLKAIEWRGGKKRIALNKEREIRHTHKGGWSQEKFQRFVASQKARTWEWIEDNLTRKGVLRGPYEKVMIEADEKIKENISSLLDSK